MDKYVELIPGKTYQHTDGAEYECIFKEPFHLFDNPAAVLRRKSDHWTLLAHGTHMVADGRIYWDYSTGGHWERQAGGVEAYD